MANTPSIQHGMTQAEECELRAKGVNFIVQVGIMLKLPQITLSTAAVYFHRIMMRASFKGSCNGIGKQHHFRLGATALFLATKVEESCRKMKQLIVAFCRVAQKNPNLLVDEQSKDWWRWRDCILHNEDVLLETLCFDLTVESPHRQLFDMLKFYGVEHNKKVRNAAWAFATDSNNTPLCLMVSSRTIAVASLYAALKFCHDTIHDDSDGRPWWAAQDVTLKDVGLVITYMCSSYDPATNKANGANGESNGGNSSIYVSLAVEGAADDFDRTRLKSEQSQSPFPPPGSERRVSNASSVGVKRERETNGVNGHHEPRKALRLDEKPAVNGEGVMLEGNANAPVDVKQEEERLRVEGGNEAVEEATLSQPAPKIEGSQDGAVEAPMKQDEKPGVQLADRHPEEPKPEEATKQEEAEASEEGEVEE